MRLYLVRHPRPAGAEGLCYGRTDLPLAEPLCAQTVAALRARIPDDVPCYTSPLQRCRLLAEALHPAPVADERLMEMDFGDWEMQPWDRIPRHELDAWAADPLAYMPPRGESVTQLQARIGAFLRERAEAPALLLVTHGGIMKWLAGLAGEEPPAVWQARRFAFGELLILDQALSHS